MKIKHTISAAALTTALVIGGGAAAFAGGSDSGTGNSDRVTELCAHQDQIVPRLTERQTKLNERIAKLTELKNKATTDAKPKLAERIAKRINHLQGALDKVTERIANAPTWIAEHCS